MDHSPSSYGAGRIAGGRAAAPAQIDGQIGTPGPERNLRRTWSTWNRAERSARFID